EVDLPDRDRDPGDGQVLRRVDDRGAAVRRRDGGRDDAEAGDGDGDVERGDPGAVASVERHDAAGPERDRRGEVDGRVPEAGVGDGYGVGAHRGGEGAVVSISGCGVADAAEHAREEMA